MPNFSLFAGCVLAAGLILSTGSAFAQCVDCHRDISPGVVSDWSESKHKDKDVGCDACHGSEHMDESDIAEALVPTPATCAECHSERYAQFAIGKHAKAWTALNAMPTVHWQPSPLIDGMKGCGGCHKIGLKTEEEIDRLKLSAGGGFGVTACDACHTRHTFSVDEARAPEACRTCHNGHDREMWEIYDGSKHGVRASLQATGVIDEDAQAPTCQTCHMPDGVHGVSATWGSFAVRLPLPTDAEWADDQATILTALGALDLTGAETKRLEGMKRVEAIQSSEETWQASRTRMISACSQCHSERFATTQLENGDEMIKNADRLMAEAIRTVAYLYEDGVLVKPDDYDRPFPDLLSLHNAPTMIELKLFEMFQNHRANTILGTFHGNPQYTLWHGWSEMVSDLTEIRELAETMRR